VQDIKAVVKIRPRSDRGPDPDPIPQENPDTDPALS
jgi:hypothetical protein